MVEAAPSKTKPNRGTVTFRWEVINQHGEVALSMMGKQLFLRRPAVVTTDNSVVSHRIHVLGKKEDLDAVRVPGKVAIVLDVLFATSTIVTAMAHGASSVTPALDEAAARAAGDLLPPGSFVLAGELYAETLPGFAPPSPLALVDHGVAGSTSSTRRRTARSRCAVRRALRTSTPRRCSTAAR